MADQHTDADPHGTRPNDIDAAPPRRSPTTAAERWSEIVENSHEGLAVLDVDRRFEFVSDRTAEMLGASGRELLGRELDRVITELTAADRAAVRAALDTGEPARLMCTRRGGDGWIRALRMTMVPRPDPRGSLIMLTQDITPLRVVQDQQRRAQHRLTAVDDEERRRIQRKIHDGPVQVLAALALRLGVIESEAIDPADLRDLEQAVDSAGRDLRDILTEPVPLPDDSPAARFILWARPLIDGSGLGLEIDDRTTDPPNAATAEALFVFVHETIKAALVVNAQRTIDVVVEHHPAGYEMTVSVPQRIEPVRDPVDERNHLGLGERYATLLGGSLRHRVDDDGNYRLTAILPQLDERGWAGTESTDRVEPPPTGSPEPLVGRGGFDMLSAADLEATAKASFQGLVELDAELRVVAVNDSYAAAFGQPADELVGCSFEDLFHPADYERLRPYVEAVVGGRPARLEWRRRNHLGEPRWTRVAASPRFDAAGRFDGAIVMTADTTNLHVAEDLRDAVQVELQQARRAARRRTAQLLDGPIRRLDGVNERLVKMAAATDREDVIRVIQRQLADSIGVMRKAIEQFADPELADMSWDDALRRSLVVQLHVGQVELEVEQPSLSPPGELGEVLRRIARDVVVDAVRNRQARRVEVRLTELGPDYSLRVVDDGRARAADVSSDDTARRLADYVALHGGVVVVHPGDQAGEVITVTIPGGGDRLVAV